MPKLTHEQFVQKINELYPDKYTVLGKYIKSAERIKIKYNLCGHISNPKAAYIRQGAGCPICNRGTGLTQDEFNQRFDAMYGEEYECLDSYINYKQTVRIKHKICGTIFPRNISTLFSDESCKCPKCNSNSAVYLIPGVNDIHTVNPELESLLKYPDDAYKHTQFSKDEVWFVCPYCGKEIYKKLIYVATNGICCPECNTNYSYGERFIANLLNVFGIKYVYQFHPDWISPYFYDFEFSINNKKYILEVDGAWHFEENYKSDLSLEDVLSKDVFKQREAEKRGYSVIRIDYNYKSKDSRTNYLISSILNSDLCKLLHLDGYDFFDIAKKAEEPITKIVADLWNSYEEKSSRKIQDELNMKDHTVRKWLYKASEIGLIKETPSEIVSLNKKYTYKIFGVHNSTRVLCNETGEIFNSFAEANRKYNAYLSMYFKFDNVKHSGILPDGTRLTWQKLA